MSNTDFLKGINFNFEPQKDIPELFTDACHGSLSSGGIVNGVFAGVVVSNAQSEGVTLKPEGSGSPVAKLHLVPGATSLGRSVHVAIQLSTFSSSSSP